MTILNRGSPHFSLFTLVSSAAVHTLICAGLEPNGGKL
ncbi:Hypothetical protein Cp106_1719 [Corynebacterium pseudotuberculosis 1/06-A]|nr:Hypothetical protein Cp4202_1751 [Corynebacterium pseudotuberculosis 42/02-A]AER69770.1 Hypothetical protein Cp106_1719 [Corynebacterium pseudotuberculosis 1/06-A]